MLPKFILMLLVASISCRPKQLKDPVNFPSQTTLKPLSHVHSIPLPPGYKRIEYPSVSFGAWLRNIHMKKDRTVFLFNGSRKRNQQAQYAVLDISTGNRDLQQCADAVIRLRAEYLFSRQQFGEIIFTDNADTRYSFKPPYSRDHFDSYLMQVFGMCGSASLSRQLKQHIEMKNISAGDVLIRGGFPGHAVLVMDVAVNDEGQKIYLLAQSYMPAQDIHILVNPSDPQLSPWYEVNDETVIRTPEYDFSKYELKRW